MNLYLIRHGESLQNLPDWAPDGPTRPDVPLTERGRAQIAALAAWLPGALPPIDAIYSSTMRRALETALALGEAVGCEAVTDDRLRDAGGNRTDGSPYPLDALPLRAPLIVREDPHATIVTDETSESYIDIRRRAALFLDEMVARHVGQHVIVVTHSGWFNAALDTILNVPVYRRGTFGMTYTSVSCLQYRADTDHERWVIWYLGRVDHLNGLTDTAERD